MESEKADVPINIRTNVRNFLKEELFAQLRKLSCPGGSGDVKLFMLIVDDQTSQILNSFIQFTDLIECNIAGLERLELRRKKLKDLHAIYFISPTKQSLDFIARDFEKAEEPQYGLIHIIFRDTIQQEAIEYLINKPNVAQRIVNIKEVHLSFDCSDENTFTFDMKGMLGRLHKAQNSEEGEIITEELGSKLASLVTALPGFWNVAFYYDISDNNLSKKVAKSAAAHLQIMLEGRKKPSEEDLPSPVAFIIMERSYDLLTPLQHDYYYSSQLMDLLDIRNNQYEHTCINEKQHKFTKISKLNETDSIWLQYRGKPFRESLKAIITGFNSFLSNNSAANLAKGDSIENMNIEKMGEIIQEIPQYQDLLGEYSFHISMLEIAGLLFNERQIDAIFEFEQRVATGMNKDFKAQPVRKLEFFPAIKQQEDKVRVGLQMLLSKNCIPDLRDQILKGIKKDGQQIYDLLKKIGIQFDSQGLNVKDPQEWSEQSDVNIDRGMCKLVEVITFLKQGQEVPNFASISVPSGEPFPSLRVSRGQALGGRLGENSSNKKLPFIIPFVLGGISVNEIRQLRYLDPTKDSKKRFGGHITIAGGTSQYSIHGFFDEIRRIDGLLPKDLEEQKDRQKIISPPLIDEETQLEGGLASKENQDELA